MHTRSCLIIIALSLMGFAGAEADTSAPNSLTASVVPGITTDWQQEIPTWTRAGLAESNTFTEVELGENRVAEGDADEAALLQALTTIAPEPERSEARVPEPTTLTFVGTGLIVIARFARRKKLEWKLLHANMPVKPTAAQEI